MAVRTNASEAIQRPDDGCDERLPHRRSRGRVLYRPRSDRRRCRPLLCRRHARHRDGPSPVADTPWIQDVSRRGVRLARAAPALEGGPLFWVATHRIHHQHSDREGDPHTPREGTSGARRMDPARRRLPKTPRCSRVTRQISLGIRPTSRFPGGTGPRTTVGVCLPAFGGVPHVLWGIFFALPRVSTRPGNEFRHAQVGSRRFETRDDSTNNCGWRC